MDYPTILVKFLYNFHLRQLKESKIKRKNKNELCSGFLNNPTFRP